MTNATLKEKIESANDWQNIATAPKDGTRIRVRHELCTHGTDRATAVWDGEGWMYSEFFIDPHTMRMYRQPTQWSALKDKDHV